MVRANRLLKFLVKYSGPITTAGLATYSFFHFSDAVTILLALSWFAQAVVLWSNTVTIKRMRDRNLVLLKENTQLKEDMDRQGW